MFRQGRAPWLERRRGCNGTMAGGRVVTTTLTLEAEVARLIVEALHLEVAPDEIDPEAPLFGEGLGLDSIDALEIALAVSRRYGFQLRSDDERNHRIFASLRALSVHIEKNRSG
jgi:acyl carrier protein